MNLITREERKVKSARIYTNDLNRIIASTKYFVSDSNSTKCYQYIKLEFCSAENRVVAIAVDGYRMSVEHSVISDCDEDFMVFIKSNIRIPKKQYATISLTEDGEEAIIRCNGFSFGFSQPESNNFDWKKAIFYIALDLMGIIFCPPCKRQKLRLGIVLDIRLYWNSGVV